MANQMKWSNWSQDLYNMLPTQDGSQNPNLHQINTDLRLPVPVHQRPRRTFDPSLSKRYGKPTFTPAKLVRYSPKYGYSRIFNFPYRGSHYRPRMNTVVIQIHGIAAPEARNPQAAGGVFFGRGAQNHSFNLDATLPQTSNRAVLEALRIALKEVITMRHTTLDPRWKEVTIMTNSEYVIKSFSEWIWQWEVNGWQRIRHGGVIEHVSLIYEIQHLFTHLEGSLNVAIRFWKVDRNDLKGADDCAKVALGLTAV